MSADERRGASAPSREPVDRRERKAWLLGVLLVALIGTLLRLPALDIDRLSDDFIHDAMVAGIYPGEGYVPFDLYAFARDDGQLDAHVDQGTVPWFAEPRFHASVLRPLSSALIWLDHSVAPGRLRLWHVHSLVWLGFTIVSFGLCVRRLLPRWPAAIALILFACDSSVLSPVGWLANRCTLVCAAWGFLAIFVHLEWRSPDPSTPTWLRRRGPLIEAGLLLASLAGGEYGLGVIAYLFAWELMVGGDRRTGVAQPWTIRARALVPAIVLAGLYLVLHVALHYGTFGADVYADPIYDPMGWLSWAKFRLPKLAAGALWGIPAETISVFSHPGASWWHARWPAANAYEAHFSHMYLSLLALAVATVAFALGYRGAQADERRTVAALLVGAGLGLLPVSVAPAHSRLLVVAQLGSCAAVAVLVCACVRLIRTPELGARTLDRALGVALIPIVAALLLLNTAGELRWAKRFAVHLDGIAEADGLAFTRGNLLDQELADRDVIVLNGPSQAVGMYGPFVLRSMGEPIPASWRSLALGGEYALFCFRSRADTLDVTAIQGVWLDTAGELFFRRANQPLERGVKFHYPGVDIEILADDGAGHPTKVRFRFPHDLDDPRYLFLTSTGAGLNRWEVPPVGRSKVAPIPRLPFPDHLLERDPAGPSRRRPRPI